ncbi:PEP-CTERM sorting domain-containing protein [Undibacterium parvum]|uniref:PEP-CTERM sorting domain-containing protein n=1 Tax=Undibacterium parvum TaxID=401471 RepID=UPI001D130C8C|nr:PEP-CTERM sorting domain-containing protein [Undibacterium parvum]
MKLKFALSAAMLLAIAGSAAAQSHQYRLNGNLNDDFGGPALISAGGSLSANDYSFAKNQGLKMDVALGGVYTLDMSFHFNNLGGYQKIVDFNNLVSDTGMYALGNNFIFYPVSDSVSNLSNGVDTRLTLTRDASSIFTMYVNGAKAVSFSDTIGRANFGSNPAHFFIDDLATSQREAGAGAVDYIRTYDHALNASQVASMTAPVPEPETYAMLLAGLGLFAGMARKRKQAE